MSAEYEQAVAARWGPRDSTVRSFWQSRVVMAEINRRVTGDADSSPVEYFAHKYCQTPRSRALSIGCGDAGLELRMLRLGVCEQLVGVDLSSERLGRARAATPAELTERIELVCANVETWRPDGRFDLIITNGAVHHLERLEAFFELVQEVLTDDGLLYLDEFVGPSRFQWTDKQIGIVNRILDRLSPELRRDLVSTELGPRPPFTRPSLAGLIAADPSEAARSAEIIDLLHEHLQTVEERPYGGAIFHQLFNRIMGNFTGHDDLVRVLMELDAILTEEAVVANDYLWGVYRRDPEPPGPGPGPTEVDGRLESIEARMIVGWAASPRERNRRIGVDVYIDHKLAAKALATLPRADLAREGVGDGVHAFRIELPSWCSDGAQHAISVVVPESGITLPVARGWEDRNLAMPEGTRFSFAQNDPARRLTAARVLGGVDGWAFPCDDEVGTIEQMLGRLQLTEPDLRRWRAVLTGRAERLAELGIPYVVTLAPAKAGVHPERLRVGSPALGAPTVGGQLLDSLSGTGVRVLDLRPPLRQAAASGAQLYYKRGSHWNFAGALIAARTLLEAVHEAGVDAGELASERIDWVQESYEGDLAGRPTVGLEGGRLVTLSPAGGAETAVRPVLESGASASGASALVLGDLDDRRLELFLGAAFSRLTCASGHRGMPGSVLESERPSVVIEVLDEPLLVRVPYLEDPAAECAGS